MSNTLTDFFKTDLVDDHASSDINTQISVALFAEFSNTETITTTRELVDNDTPIQLLTATTTDTIVELPVEDVTNHAMFIYNAGASTDYNLILNNDSSTETFATIPLDGWAYCFPDSGDWHVVTSVLGGGEPATELTVSGGVLTLTKSMHSIQPQSGTADDVDTINAPPGVYLLYPSDEGVDTITYKHGTGNLDCFGAADIANLDGAVVAVSDGTTVFMAGGGGAAAASTVYAPTGHMLNGYLDVTTDSGDLVVAIKNAAGNDPSTSDPVYIRLGNADHTLSAALSVTVSAGVNTFNAGSTELATHEIPLFFYMGYNATDGLVIGPARIPFARQFGDFSTDSTNEKYCSINDISNAASTDPYEVVGYFHAINDGTTDYAWTLPATPITISRPIFTSEWVDLTPTTLASGSMTYTTTSLELATYQVIYNTVHIVYAIEGTTGGTASNTIRATLPFEGKNTAKFVAAAGYADDGGGAVGGLCFLSTGTPDNVSVKKYDASNFGLGSARKMYPDITYEIL